MANIFRMRKKLLFVLIAWLCTSCEKVLMMDDIAPTATNTFEYLWQRVDSQYSMFDVKGVDWDAVYDTFRPQVYDDMSYDSLYSVCASMLSMLNDGHVNLYTSYDVARADTLYRDFYACSGIDINLVVLHYLGTRYHMTGGMAHSALCDGRVIYMNYGSFSNGITVSQLRHIVSLYPRAEGMVLDIRGNGGGNVANIDRILHLMPSHGQQLYSSQIKSGAGHDDFGPLQPTFAPVVVDTEAFMLPVVVLIDKGCFSAASAFAVCTQAYENMTLMGDSTSGGLGLPAMGALPNGWLYRLPVTRTIALDGKNYENGVPPDVYVPFDRAMAAMGRDNIIDSACALILKK